MTKLLHILTGPTAVGKTDVALTWAETNNAEIVSCDSLLFYRGMDIGTAKPTPAERQRVPHHLIDILDLRERMDVARYVDLARRAIEDIAARGRRILVVGGSGFYLRSFFAPVADQVEIPAEVRQRVAALEPAAAVAELARIDPDGLSDLDAANPRRVARALERRLAANRPLRELAAAFAAQPPPFAGWDVKLARLDRPAATLDERIKVRVEDMLAAGLIEEVRRLIPAGLRENPSASRAIGYRECLDFVDGRIPLAALAGTIARDTRALVKKQQTWFRTQLPEHRVLAADARPDSLFHS